jgi:hypothetical protein
MNKEIISFLIFIILGYITFTIFRNLNLNFKEGMTTDSSGNSTTNGIAGNAATYAANIKASSIQIQDMLLVSKYRTDYENAILNLEDLINNMMLKTVLNIDKSSPQQGLAQLVNLSQSKSALNEVMKYVDQSS